MEHFNWKNPDIKMLGETLSLLAAVPLLAIVLNMRLNARKQVQSGEYRNETGVAYS